jgi:DNA-binding HxlR family transcriptional regulator
MALLDLLGRRWALRIIWELRAGPLTSRSLREACGGVSPTVLHDRVIELREARLVELNEPSGYALTSLGRQLLEKFLPLVDWSQSWAAALGRERR